MRNVDTGVTKPSLQQAVRAASAGDTLRVKGTCKGAATVGKDLTIIGIATGSTGTPILGGYVGSDTDPVHWVVKVKSGTSVTIRDLTIRGGHDASGIQNHGRLALRDVTVRDNLFQAGGGIWNEGTVVMNGATLIMRNESAWGAGVIVFEGARLVMNDSSAIRGNTAYDTGGGVMVGEGGTLVMNDFSVIGKNTASNGAHPGGGGVHAFHDATLAMRGSSAIRGNTAATGPGGGILDDRATLTGVVCAPDADQNVWNNSPDDCFTVDEW